MGWFANKIGQKNALHLCLAVWIVVLFSGFLITEVWQFWIMAALTALVMGSTQSVSRTIMGLMTPESRTGEFFGFFNLSGKAFSMLGPILFTEILNAATGSANWAIISLLVFFRRRLGGHRAARHQEGAATGWQRRHGAMTRQRSGTSLSTQGVFRNAPGLPQPIGLFDEPHQFAELRRLGGDGDHLLGKLSKLPDATNTRREYVALEQLATRRR